MSQPDTPADRHPAGARIASQRVYAGRVINVERDRVRFPDGSEGDLEMIRHPGASAVIPVVSTLGDPEILLIRQYRYAVDGVIWEIPAGVLEQGEAPDDCARRELREETGFEAGHVDRLTTIFTTPGFTDEQIHLFAGYDLAERSAETEPDEFIEVEQIRLSAALQLIREGGIVDGKTIVALLFYESFRQSI